MDFEIKKNACQQTVFKNSASRHFYLPRIVGASMVLLLSGCTGAKIANVTSVDAGSPSPTEILVQVDSTPIDQDTNAATLTKVTAALQSDLIEQLTKARVTAEPFVPGTSHPGAAVLHISIAEADPGSALERIIIGFGAGQARLQAEVDFETADTRAAQTMTAFDTSSNSGYQPGLIVPGGVALATGRAVHLAIGAGIDVALNVRGGLARPTEKTASAVVNQLKKYYASVGWIWPADRQA
ncbi:MAG TPA: DUF4410 domain-containing protein [Acidocella sp.]|uniref:DUF4410 domain-containing protein n=1 Tax=Acidocella sp. TaxID=50710 RepID=UPI002BAA671A|nr:DUF4410 domain-containing protein [Acidocella sp.]HVE20459.1 DUF4410 domain-containing protein [Acidocella sp.]